MRNPTPVAEVVEDVIANMPEVDKANVVNTPENSFITFHHGGVPNRAKGGYLVRIWSLNGNYTTHMIKYLLWFVGARSPRSIRVNSGVESDR